jgi:hypothetical protein
MVPLNMSSDCKPFVMSSFISPWLRENLIEEELRPQIEKLERSYCKKIELAATGQEKSELKRELKNKVKELRGEYRKNVKGTDPHCLY